MIKQLVAPLVAAVFLAGIFGVLPGCNTIEGAGKDIQKGGKAISNKANERR